MPVVSGASNPGWSAAGVTSSCLARSSILQLLFVLRPMFRMVVLDDIDHARTALATSRHCSVGGRPHGGQLSHHRRRDVALLGQGALLFSLQSHPASMGA